MGLMTFSTGLIAQGIHCSITTPDRLIYKMKINNSIAILCLFFLLPCVFLLAAVQPCKGATQTRVAITGNKWIINGQPVLADSPAEGLLMNVRMVNAVFEDTGPYADDHLKGFDPETNTERFVQQIPEYVDHRARAFTISLQGDFPSNEGAVNSAYNADGR